MGGGAWAPGREERGQQWQGQDVKILRLDFIPKAMKE